MVEEGHKEKVPADSKDFGVNAFPKTPEQISY